MTSSKLLYNTVQQQILTSYSTSLKMVSYVLVLAHWIGIWDPFPTKHASFLDSAQSGKKAVFGGFLDKNRGNQEFSFINYLLNKTRTAFQSFKIWKSWNFSFFLQTYFFFCGKYKWCDLKAIVSFLHHKLFLNFSEENFERSNSTILFENGKILHILTFYTIF